VAGRQGGQAAEPPSLRRLPDLLDRLILIPGENECVVCLRERVVEDADPWTPRCCSAPALRPSAVVPSPTRAGAALHSGGAAH